MRPIAMALALGTVFWSPVEGGTGRADAVDRQKVVDALKKQWAAIKTLEVHGEEFVCDAPGVRSTREGVPHSEFDFHMAPNARRALKVTYVFPDGRRELSDNFREDGRRLYQIEAFRGSPETIDRIRVTAQQSTATRQHEMRNSLFVWCWTPNGNALHTYLDRGEPLETFKDDEGRPLVRLKVPAERISLELDPSRDFALRRCILTGFEEFVATRYESIDGAWLPMEGYRFRYSGPGKPPNYRGFRVREVKVNRPIADGTFTLPKLPGGAIVSDETGGKSFIQGGIEERKRAQNKYVRKEATPPERGPTAPAQTGVTASPPNPTSFSWSILLLATAGAFFIVAWRLVARAS